VIKFPCYSPKTHLNGKNIAILRAQDILRDKLLCYSPEIHLKQQKNSPGSFLHCTRKVISQKTNKQCIAHFKR
jgi:hypothetical protein